MCVCVCVTRMRRNGSADGNGTSLVRCVIEEKVGTETLGAVSASDILHSSCCFLIGENFFDKRNRSEIERTKESNSSYFFLHFCFYVINPIVMKMGNEITILNLD